MTDAVEQQLDPSGTSPDNAEETRDGGVQSEFPLGCTGSPELPESAKDEISDASNDADEEPVPTSERTNSGGRDSISLQRVASVEEISRAMAKAEKSRPRRRRQESETMQKWKEEFEERLKKKDELESEAIEQLRIQADNEKTQWYEQWRKELAERRKQHMREREEASDQVDEDVWIKMSRLAKSLNSRKNSQDLNRLKAFSRLLDDPPRTYGAVPMTR
ncbi:microfibrillar-associated protein 1 [Galendromus occidentalis]|uniref:Clathrin light chain n=1 Tax=Galendromus occidentalis TaxID=34638 RepID=A0AAJ6QP22_9ACAR|nr:microfibrillar-associated protein 1 [Galendromus occidentalis]